MPAFLRLPTNPILWTLCGVLAISGCKCKPTNEPPPREEVVVQDTTNKMSVTGIDPSRVSENKPFSATVRGSGFKSGATVTIGVQDATNVTYLNGNQLAIDVAGMPAGRYDVEVTNPDGSSSISRGALTVDVGAVMSCDPAIVYFETDSSTVKDEGKRVLESRAGCYAKSTATVRVDGHCDERGTTDYNLALGERRAKAVKTLLTGAGVPADRITTTSYGEEQPVDPGHDESAWNKNRRAEVSSSR